MREEKLRELLNKLADATTEPVRPDLDEDIRHQIPHRLVRHRVNWNTISIIIDLRLSRSVAAAVIIITIFLWASFLGGWNTSPDQMYEDSKLLIQYGLAGENAGRADVLASLEKFHKHLADRGRTVTYYGQSADPDDRNIVLMHWKLPDGRYRVIFNDLSARSICPATLIRLQTYMLEKQMER